jgi:molecular chaperone GrpE
MSGDEEETAAPAPEGAAERGLAPADGSRADQPEASAEERVAALKAENASLKEDLLRRRADFENYKRRADRDRQNTWKEAAADLLRSLVPTLDNLERALQASPEDEPLREGVQLIQRELLGLLESRGVSVEDPTGLPFDPERHQALSHEAVAGARSGTVVETFRKGYLFKDRLLRPALVKVAKDAPADAAAERPEILQ